MIRMIAIACLVADAHYAAEAVAQESGYERQQAAAAELAKMCKADGGRLWGVSLCGPLIVVDLQTRAAWASQADPGGVLRPAGDGWIGVLPDDAPVANTAVEWSGLRWTMVMVVSLSENRTDRRVLLAHEAWHRIQPELGLVTRNTDNAHLEDERGRYLLRLELRALRIAMETHGTARWRAARDALQLRAARLRHYPAAAEEEAALDRNEGIAAYTGVKLGAAENAHAYAARTLERHDANDAYSRSYAYGSGPAYGLLLDERRPDWRTPIGENAPADMLADALGLRSSAGALASAERRHDPEGQVAAAEAKRGEAHRALVAELRDRYGSGSRKLVLAIDPRMMSFDPRRVTPVAGVGRVFGVFSARGPWGSLQARDGALVTADFSQVSVANPAADGLTGRGWTLTLAPGYRISEPDEDGALRVLPPDAQEGTSKDVRDP